MPLLPSIGRTLGTGIKAARLLVRGTVLGGAWATRRVGTARARGAANEIGMIRLFDLHAISCAGDTLIAIGLAGTIFFNVPLGEARSKVALYLLVTMVPFALLAPVVGPLLDHFRHGRRYALAVTMLGRAFLAYVISVNLLNWELYPAAFGVLALSRAYGVARSAAVPRLLPQGIGLSQVGARASVYGTFAGALVAPIGLLTFKFGPQWPLRVSTILFVVGMVISLRLPPRADSDPPEAVPRPWRTVLGLGRNGGDRPLSGKLVVSTLIGSASLRLLYGFLLLFLTFVIMANQLNTVILGTDVGKQGAVGLIGGALAVGTFLSTAVGTRLRIRRPLAMQSAGLTITAGVAVLSAIFYTLPMLALLALLTAIFSGIAKLAIDASIQERVPERLRASAFAHSETVLMVAWVAGGAVGLIPVPGRWGVGLGALLALVAAVRAGVVAARLHNERLSGRSDGQSEIATLEAMVAAPDAAEPGSATVTGPGGAGDDPTDPWPNAPTVPARNQSTTPAQRGPSRPGSPQPGSGQPGSGQPGSPQPGSGQPGSRQTGSGRTGSGQPSTSRPGATQPGSTPSGSAKPDPARPDPARPASDRLDTTRVDTAEPPAARKRWFGRRKDKAAPEPVPARTTPEPAPSEPEQPTAGLDPAVAPPGYHVYRPSSAGRPSSDPGPVDDDEV